MKICFFQRALFFDGKKEISKENLDRITQGYTFLNAFLEENQWVAGDQITIADFCCGATVSSLNHFVPVDKEKYPNTFKWLTNFESHRNFEVGRKGLETFKSFIDYLMKK